MRLVFLTMAALGLSALVWAETEAGLTWTVPAGWKNLGSRPMRVATYEAPPAPGDKEPAEIVVFYFGQGQGGGVQANVDRWIGQFQDKPASPPKPTVRTVAGMRVTTIEHKGTYLSGPPMGEKIPKPGYQLVGSIVEGPQGNVFFRLTGPAKTVEATKPAFEKMISSIRK
jgi:hypothetical protein